jgi:hypothetical protein
VAAARRGEGNLQVHTAQGEALAIPVDPIPLKSKEPNHHWWLDATTAATRLSLTPIGSRGPN